MTQVFEGACLCKEIEYTLEGEPDFPHYCSCKMCQSWSGAPTVAWVDFPKDGLKFAGTEPSWYRSSDFASRGFCPKCGGTMFALDDESKTICVTIASLNQVDQIRPDSISFPDSAPSWFEVKHELKSNT